MEANSPQGPHDDNRLPIAAAPRPRPLAAVPADHGTALGTALRYTEPEPERDDDEIDLLDYWRIIVKRRWTVLATLALVFAIALVGTLLMTPIYRASTTLQIDRDSIKVVNVGDLTPGESPLDKDYYQTQYELLQSRALAQRVIAQLALADHPVWQRMSEPSPLAKLLGSVFGASDDSAEALAKPGASGLAESRRITAFLEHLSVEPVRNSRLVRIHFDSIDPAFSAKVVNAMAEAYIASALDRRFESSSYAKNFLEDQLQQLKLRLQDSEKELVVFAQKERIVDIDDHQSLVAQNLSQLNEALSRTQDERMRAEARYMQAQMTDGIGLADVLDSKNIQDLQAKRSAAQAEYQDKLRVFKPDYPEMLRLKGQIDEFQRLIDAQAADIKGAIAGNFAAARAQENLLHNQIDELKVEVLDLQSRSIQYNILKREVDTNRQLYDGLLQRFKEVGLAGGVGTNNISVVDRAEVPTGKHSPRLALNLALGLLLGGFAGVSLAFLTEHLDDTIKSPEDIEKLLRLAVLGIIPKLKVGTPIQALADPRSAFAEAYRSLRTALQFSTSDGVPRSLLITSATPSEGKSTTALVLAQNFAQLGRRVLLIDADLRNPSQHKLLGLDNGAGLSNCLTGAVKVPELIQATRTEGLSVLLAGPLPPNPAELLAGPRLVSLLTAACHKYDQVIIDGPPVMGLADAPIIANQAGGTLLVVEFGNARMGVVRASLKRLAAARVRLLGALLTKFDVRSAGYGYGYGDHSYYSYGDTPKLGQR
ncbi:MAG: exopolysaccharide biosynthesis protein [Lysobacterales bacterium CG17_big_fil_post_rev_8_21_14_2_50_64_11]|nr:MAG: exopolysaccharide biosynthesis protein [Xanthomonadales bacterium CG17_big_fil_post_rev_8_21_14_2_50_64_11]PIX60354.1 MAG: exopolysaccharide biosynthesis protein [Xanthomonadales bacterium CG_4_10_14_3_um_filter_64_11]